MNNCGDESCPRTMMVLLLVTWVPWEHWKWSVESTGGMISSPLLAATLRGVTLALRTRSITKGQQDSCSHCRYLRDPGSGPSQTSSQNSHPQRVLMQFTS